MKQQYLLSHPFLLKLDEYNYGNVLMFTTKEATTTIRMGKLTFQDFNFYFFGDTVTKKGCIFLVMNIFIGDLIRDNKTAG